MNEWMVYQEASSGFVIYKFLKQYCSPQIMTNDIFLEINLAKDLQVLVFLNGWQAHAVEGREVCMCMFQNAIHTVLPLH